MKLLLLGLVALACGCALLAPVDSRSGAEIFNDRWAGKAEDDVILHYGRPDDVLELSSGNRVDSFHRSVAYSKSSAMVYGAAGGASSDSSTVYCDRRFEIDKSTSHVVRAVITGSSCDYDR